jgi:hypothetical protein
MVGVCMNRKVSTSLNVRLLSILTACSTVFFSGQARADAFYDYIYNNMLRILGDPIKAAEIALDMVTSRAIGEANTEANKLLLMSPCSGTGRLSDIFCNVMDASDGLPGFVTAICYMLGLLLVVIALVKLKDHVLNPNQTPLSDSMKRFVVGGAFFTLPLITEATQNLLIGGGFEDLSPTAYAGAASGGYGLDTMLVYLFSDLYGPIMSVIFAFAYLAGLILTVVGISRILKTAQDGPRGPSGMGTIMTFVIAGVLFSLNSIMTSFTASMFNGTYVATYAVLGTSTGDMDVDNHILATISTVLVFMTIMGYISFLRGFFILRGVAEGTGQASLMAAVTHMFGGALAVNLGPLMNAVQSTLGLEDFGVTFW